MNKDLNKELNDTDSDFCYDFIANLTAVWQLKEAINMHINSMLHAFIYCEEEIWMLLLDDGK